jgi:hypothetical protein
VGSNVIWALNFDQEPGGYHWLNFAITIRPPIGEQLWNGVPTLQVRTVQLADEYLGLAVANNGTNAPDALSADQLKQICDTNNLAWGGLEGGYTGPAPDHVIRLVLPAEPGSIERYRFMHDIRETSTTCSNSAVTYGDLNDPTVITSSPAASDTIFPMSSARINLYDSGYFHDPSAAFPGGAALTSGVHLLSGSIASDGQAAYHELHHVYAVFRQADADSTTPWQAGGTKNWAQELFIRKGTSKPFFSSAAGQALLEEAGFTPDYVDSPSYITDVDD